MKRSIKCILLLIICFFSLNLSKVEAISSFPSKVYVDAGELIALNGWHIYKIHASGDGIASKAMCVSFWKYEPEGLWCSKNAWSSDSNKNKAAAAAIGTIIQKARSSDGSMTWTNFFYAEIAINKFIYDNDIYGSNRWINNVNSAPRAILNHIRSWVNDATSLYKELYNNYKNNAYKIVFDGNINENNGKITAKFHCESNGKKVACSNLNIVVKNDTSGKTNKYSTVQNSDKSITVTSDFSEPLKNSDVTAKISVSTYVRYPFAQRYYCGSYQSVTPNALASQDLKASNSKSKNLTKKVVETCDTKLAAAIKDGTYQSKVHSLYQEYRNPGTDQDKIKRQIDLVLNGNILNAQKPSCTDTSSDISTTCNKAHIERTWTTTRKDATSTNMYICTVKFDFKNEVYDKDNGYVGDLIYYSPTGTFGTATAEYTCYDPITPSNFVRTSNYAGRDFRVGRIIPNIKLELLDKEITMSGKVSSSGIKNLVGKCSTDGTNINCSEYGKINIASSVGCNSEGKNCNQYEVTGVKFTLNAKYIYPEGTYSEKNINGVSQKGILLNSTNDDTEQEAKITIETGPAITSESTGDTDYNSQIIANSSSKVGSCKFYINSNSTPEILYRTVNTSAPFLNYEGKVRKTGGNWCGEISNGTVEDMVEDFNDGINSCAGQSNLPGDVNNNYNWDKDDITKIKDIIASGGMNARADANGDGKIDDEDVTEVEKNILQMSEAMIGDVNLDGIIDETDSELIQKHISNLIGYKFQGLQYKLADVDKDCEVSILDATKIQRYITGVETCLGGCENDEEENYTADNLDNLKSDLDNKYCSGNPSYNDTVKNYISDRPDSDGVITSSKLTGVKKKTEPLYRFVLTPEKIKAIREYNQSNGIKGNYTSFKGNYVSGKFVSDFVEKLKKDNQYVANSVSERGECSKSLDRCDINAVISSMISE